MCVLKTLPFQLLIYVDAFTIFIVIYHDTYMAVRKYHKDVYVHHCHLHQTHFHMSLSHCCLFILHFKSAISILAWLSAVDGALLT